MSIPPRGLLWLCCCILLVRGKVVEHGVFGNGPNLFKIQLTHEALIGQLSSQLPMFLHKFPQYSIRVFSVGVLESAHTVHETNMTLVGDIVMGNTMTNPTLAVSDPETGVLGEWIDLTDMMTEARHIIGYPMQKAVPKTADSDCTYGRGVYCLPWYWDIRGIVYNIATYLRLGLTEPSQAGSASDIYSIDQFFADQAVLATETDIPFAMEPFTTLSFFTAMLQSKQLDMLTKDRRSNLRHPDIVHFLDTQYFPWLRQSPNMTRMFAGKWFPRLYSALHNKEFVAQGGDYADVTRFENAPAEDWPATKGLPLCVGTGRIPARYDGAAQVGGSGTAFYRRARFPGTVGPRIIWTMGISRRSTLEIQQHAFRFMLFLYDMTDLNSEWARYNMASTRRFILNDVVKRSTNVNMTARMSTAAERFSESELNRAASFFFPQEGIATDQLEVKFNCIGIMGLNVLKGMSTLDNVNYTSECIDAALHQPKVCVDPKMEWNGTACAIRMLRDEDALVIRVDGRQKNAYLWSAFIGVATAFLMVTLLSSLVTCVSALVSCFQVMAYSRGTNQYEEYVAASAKGQSLGVKENAGYINWMRGGGFAQAICAWMTSTSLVAFRSLGPANMTNITGVIGEDAPINLGSLVVSTLAIPVMTFLFSSHLKWADQTLLERVFLAKQRRQQKDADIGEASVLSRPGLTSVTPFGARPSYLPYLLREVAKNSHGTFSYIKEIEGWTNIFIQSHTWSGSLAMALAGCMPVLSVLAFEAWNTSLPVAALPNWGFCFAAALVLSLAFDLSLFAILWMGDKPRLTTILSLPCLVLAATKLATTDWSYTFRTSRITGLTASIAYDDMVFVWLIIAIVMFATTLILLLRTTDSNIRVALKEISQLNKHLANLKDDNLAQSRIILLLNSGIPLGWDIQDHKQLFEALVPADELKQRAQLRKNVEEKNAAQNPTPPPAVESPPTKSTRQVHPSMSTPKIELKTKDAQGDNFKSLVLQQIITNPLVTQRFVREGYKRLTEESISFITLATYFRTLEGNSNQRMGKFLVDKFIRTNEQGASAVNVGNSERNDVVAKADKGEFPRSLFDACVSELLKVLKNNDAEAIEFHLNTQSETGSIQWLKVMQEGYYAIAPLPSEHQIALLTPDQISGGGAEGSVMTAARSHPSEVAELHLVTAL